MDRLNEEMKEWSEQAEHATQLPPLPEGEFCVYGNLVAHEGKADALAELYTHTTLLAQSEPGIVYMCISRDTEDLTVFHFFERYTGSKAFEDHFKHPLVQRVLEEKLIKTVNAKFGKPIHAAQK